MLDAIGNYWWLLIILALIVWLTVTYQRQKKQMERMRAQATSESPKAIPGSKVILDSGMHGTIREVRDHSYLIEIAPDVLVEFEKYGVIFNDASSPVEAGNDV